MITPQGPERKRVVRAPLANARGSEKKNPLGGLNVSIIRVGLAENKKFAQGYEAIFGKSKKDQSTAAQPKPDKKPAAKKKAKKK
jgi:hypothetical protein